MSAPTSGQVSAQYIGVSNLTVAQQLTDVAGGSSTYDTPLSLGKVLIQVQLQPQTAKADLYADNQSIDSVNVVQKVNISINMAALPLEYTAYLLGHSVVNGVMTVDKDDVPPYVAVMFESNKRNGKKRYVKYYKVQFAESDSTENTQSENIEYNTPTLEGSMIYRLSDGLLGIIADEEAPDYVASTGASWFDAV